MDTATRTQLITAAVTAVGPQHLYSSPAEWNAAVSDLVIQLTVWGSDRSPIAQRIANWENSKAFDATVLSIREEASSRRAYVILHTGTDREYADLPAGCEAIRTDRTDLPLGMNMARRVRSLVGYRVLLWRGMESFAGGEKNMRVLQHIEPLYLDPEYEAKALQANVRILPPVG